MSYLGPSKVWEYVQEHEENVLIAIIDALWMRVWISGSVESVGQYKAGNSNHLCLRLAK